MSAPDPIIKSLELVKEHLLDVHWNIEQHIEFLQYKKDNFEKCFTNQDKEILAFLEELKMWRENVRHPDRIKSEIEFMRKCNVEECIIHQLEWVLTPEEEQQ